MGDTIVTGRTLALGCAALCALAGPYACQEYGSDLLTSGRDASGGASGLGGGDAAPDVSTGGSGAADAGPFWQRESETGCLTEGRPTAEQRPAAGSAAVLDDIYLAMSRIRLGSTADDPPLTPDDKAWQSLGFRS